jgi:hypothetical protein
MLDLLSEDPRGWRPLIAEVWSRYAGLIHVWQIGRDGRGELFLDDRLPAVIPTVRQEMATLMSNPRLATTASALYAPAPGRLTEYESVALPVSLSPDEIARQGEPFVRGERDRTWFHVEPLDREVYPRVVRLADLARRLAEAHYHEAGGVFMAAPWSVETEPFAARVNPDEDYLIYRTVADVLGGAKPVSRTVINGRAEALVFDRQPGGILFVHDRYAPPEGREHVLMLGEGAEQVDLWGNRTPLPTVEGRQVVRIGPTPTFIINASTWLIEFRREFRIEPSLVEASFEGDEHVIVFRNTYHEPITGHLRLHVPESWDVRPDRIAFALPPGEVFREPVAIRFPHNVEAGVRALVGEFHIDAIRRYEIMTPAWFEIGLNGIDLDTFVFRTGDRVIVRQSITNRTGQATDFEGYLLVPNRQRLTRLFTNFLPGQSITKDFILDAASDLTGRQVRIGLKELRGTRVWNRVITVP